MCDFFNVKDVLRSASTQIPDATLVFRGYITGNVNKENWNVGNKYNATDQVPVLGSNQGIYCLVSARLLEPPENFLIGLSEEEIMRRERTKICYHYAYWNGTSFHPLSITNDLGIKIIDEKLNIQDYKGHRAIFAISC